MSKIRYEVDDKVATITLNDPDTLNAASLSVVDAFIDALTKAGREARCVIITGEGRGFCSGANLAGGDFKEGQSDPEHFDVGRLVQSHNNPMVLAMRDHPTPILTAVNGIAAGVGCSLALMGDIVLASEKASFLQAFSRIGLVPDGGSSWLLARTIGRVRAMEMALLAEKLPAEKALEWGMINRICAPDALMPEARKIALQLGDGPVSLAMTRKLIWSATDSSFADALHAERLGQRDAGFTRDAKEGINAFLEKRAAEFKGE